MNSFHKLVTVVFCACAALYLLTLFAMQISTNGSNQGMTMASSVTGSTASAPDVKELTDKSDHKAEVEDSDIPVVIDFSALAWCPPCQRMAPHFDKIAKDYKGKVKFFLVNPDVSPELCKKYAVRGYPTVFFIKPKNGGQTSVVGYEDEAKLKGNVDKLLDEKKPDVPPATTK